MSSNPKHPWRHRTWRYDWCKIIEPDLTIEDLEQAVFDQTRAGEQDRRPRNYHVIGLDDKIEQ